MTTSYFTQADGQALEAGMSAEAQMVVEKLTELHRLLHRRMRDHNWDIHPQGDKLSVVTNRTAACANAISGAVLPYTRSREQAHLVERLMGREGVSLPTTVDIHRHPVIEVRLTPNNFVIELIVSPSSWWDQRNFMGKFAIERHRQTLRGLLSRMEEDWVFGFWEGCALDDMHLTSRQLLRGTILEEWMGTFADGQDLLRVGMWYDIEHPALTTDRILSETVSRVGTLYGLYNFLLWTSNNNFQSFYRGGGVMTGSGRDNRL